MSNLNHDRWNDDAIHAGELALREALADGKNYIGAEHVLIAAARVFLDSDEVIKVQDMINRATLCPTCGQQLPDA
jgi:hypothetical protein